MRHRLLVISLFLFATPGKSQSEVSSKTSDTIIEAPAVDVFSDRSGIWPSKRTSATDVNSDSLNSFESLMRTPGIQSRFEGSPTISIRGSQSLPRVLGMYNGIPLNGAGGLGPNRLLMPHEAVGEIQVFKGPASVFWGSDAMGGAVNFLSRKFDRPTVRGNLGSYGQRGLFGVLPFGVGESSYNHLTSFVENYDGDYPYTWSHTGREGVRYSNNRSIQRHSYFGEQKIGRWSFAENLLWAQELSTSPGAVNSPWITHTRSRSGLASLNTNYIVSSDTEVSHRVFGIRSDNDYRDPNGTNGNSASTVGNSLSVRQRWSPNLSSDIFLDHKYDDYLYGQYYTTSDTEVGGTFDYSINESLILKPGTRYLFSYQRLVNALGLFEQSGNLKRWLTYSEGFHAPSLGQRYSNSSYSLANPDLKPESSSQVEIGFNQNLPFDPDRPWNSANVELSAFSIQYQDIIVSNTVAPNQTRPSNVDKASGWGVEFQSNLNYEVWRFKGAYSYLKTEDKNKKPLPLSPENQYQLAVGYRWSILYTELGHTISDKFYDSSVPLNSWDSTDLKIETLDVTSWKFTFAVLNIFNRPIELTYGYPDSQRRFLATVERKF